jgi:hypothetical protein
MCINSKINLKAILMTLSEIIEPGPFRTRLWLFILALMVLQISCEETKPRHFLDISVSANNVKRTDKPVIVKIDRKKFVNGVDGHIMVVEIDEVGEVIDSEVLSQFDYNKEESSISDELIFIMKGETAANETRRFRVHFEPEPITSQEIIKLVKVHDYGPYEGEDAFKITSQNAVYFYHKRGSGFASMIDIDGNDWISYHPTDDQNGPKGAYRGIPNLWNAGFHPGRPDGKLESKILSSGPIRTRIFSQTEDRKWKCTWDIYPRYATMTLLQRGGKPYWILYEGTPGGEFNLSDYWVLSDGRRLSVEPFQAEHMWKQPLPSPKWVYFGDADMSRILYLVYHSDHDELDQFWHFGEKTMTVFGFGRGESGTRHWQQLTAVPAKFTIGFSSSNVFEYASEVINDAFQPLKIKILN